MPFEVWTWFAPGTRMNGCCAAANLYDTEGAAASIAADYGIA
jgi:hypothetical protein